MKSFEELDKEVKYVVESNGEDFSLLYRLLVDNVNIEESGAGKGVFANEENNSNLVSINYCWIEKDLYVFYEPTAVRVDWEEVDLKIKSMFPKAEKIKTSCIPFKYM